MQSTSEKNCYVKIISFFFELRMKVGDSSKYIILQ